MTTEKKFTMSKSLGALIISLIAAAFLAGTRTKLALPEAEAHVVLVDGAPPRVTASGLGGAPPAELVTAESVRSLVTDIRDLRKELTDATKAVGVLSERLARLEGACGRVCGGN